MELYDSKLNYLAELNITDNLIEDVKASLAEYGSPEVLLPVFVVLTEQQCLFTSDGKPLLRMEETPFCVVDKL
jgi:hypothetical protein